MAGGMIFVEKGAPDPEFEDQLYEVLDKWEEKGLKVTVASHDEMNGRTKLRFRGVTKGEREVKDMVVTLESETYEGWSSAVGALVRNYKPKFAYERWRKEVSFDDDADGVSDFESFGKTVLGGFQRDIKRIKLGKKSS